MLIILPNVYKYTRFFFYNFRHVGILHAQIGPGTTEFTQLILSIFLVESHVGYNCFRRFCILPKQPHFPCLDIWWCQEARICWKVKEFQKNIYFYFIDYAKAFDCVDHNILWKILKEMEYQTTWPASWETCMQVRKQQLELIWNKRLVPNRKRSTSRLYIVTLLI